MGISLYGLHELEFLGGRTGFDMDTCHFFPWDVLTAITLVEDGGTEAGAGYEVGFPSAHDCHLLIGSGF